jgi:hypothetical protein
VFGGTGGFGLLRTTNGGASWTRLSNPFSFGTVQALLVLPNGDVVAGVIGPAGGVYRSTNNGTSFSSVTTGITNSNIYSLAANPAGHLFAGTAGGGVFRSTNNGASWTAVNTGIDPPDQFINSLIVGGAGELYAATGTKLYRSTNNGDSWSPLLPVPAASYSSLSIAPNGDIYAAVTSIGGVRTGGVFKSTSGGATWTQEAGLPETPHNAIITSGTRVYVGTEGPGVYCSTGGLGPRNVWDLCVDGMDNTHVTDIEQKQDGVLYAATRYNRVFKSTDYGRNWSSASNGLSYDWINDLAVNPLNGHVYAATPFAVWRSTDDGGSWQEAKNSGATALAINRNGTIFSGFGGQMFRSTDDGSTWSVRLLNGVSTIAQIATDTNKVYVATGNGTTGQGVHRSTDNGETYETANRGLTDLNVMTVAVNEGQNTCGTVNAGNGDGWWELARDTSAWRRVGLSSTPVRKMQNLRGATGTGIFALAAAFLYSRDESCAITFLFGTNFSGSNGDPPISLLVLGTPNGREVSTVGRRLLLGTNGLGIYASDNALTGIDDATGQPSGIVLHQNYPNPFNPSTTIAYDLPEDGHVRLAVFDLLGRQVALLVDEVQPAGYRSVRLNASALASGVYLYRLEAGGMVQARRLVVVK